MDKDAEAANGYGKRAGFTIGDDNFVGTSLGDDRGDPAWCDDARRQHDKVISEVSDSKGREAQRVWKGVSDHWRGGLPATESEITAGARNDAEHPRGQSGKRRRIASSSGGSKKSDGGEKTDIHKNIVV